MNRFHLTVCVTTLAAASAGAAQAGTLWVAKLTGAGEVPPNTQPFTGSGFLILDNAETTATVRAVHDVPNPIAGHIHRGPAGVNGPVIFGFPGTSASPVGPLTWAIPAADVANLKSGGLYVNIHTAAFPGGIIRDQLRRSILANSVTGAGPQTAAANALDVSAGFNAELDQILMTAAIAAPAAQAQIVTELSAGTVYSQGRQAIEAMHDAETSLFSHAEDLPSGEGFGVFARAGHAFGNRDTTAGQVGAKVSRTSLMGGFDYSTASHTLGAAVAYADGDDKFKGGLGRTDAKITSVHVFGSTRSTGLKFSAAAGYGWIEFEGTRSLPTLARSADFSHDGKIWSVAAKVQAPMAMGGNFELSPYALVDMHKASIDAYSETGAGATSLVVAKHKHKSAALEAGAAVVVPKRDDATWSARFEAGWRYLLDEGDDTVAARLAGSPITFDTTFVSPGRSAAHLAAMVVGELSPTITASFGYRGLIAKHSDVHTLQVRIAMRLP